MSSRSGPPSLAAPGLGEVEPVDESPAGAPEVQLEFARAYVETPRIVVSDSLQQGPDGVRLVRRADAVAEVERLRADPHPELVHEIDKGRGERRPAHVDVASGLPLRDRRRRQALLPDRARAARPA